MRKQELRSSSPALNASMTSVDDRQGISKTYEVFFPRWALHLDPVRYEVAALLGENEDAFPLESFERVLGGRLVADQMALEAVALEPSVLRFQSERRFHPDLISVFRAFSIPADLVASQYYPSVCGSDRETRKIRFTGFACEESLIRGNDTTADVYWLHDLKKVLERPDGLQWVQRSLDRALSGELTRGLPLGRAEDGVWLAICAAIMSNEADLATGSLWDLAKPRKGRLTAARRAQLIAALPPKERLDDGNLLECLRGRGVVVSSADLQANARVAAKRALQNRSAMF
jgi:hypothetical protein